MALPDVDRLSRLADDDLRALRQRLHAIALDAEAIERVIAPTRGIPAPQADAIVRWHARRASGDAGVALRAFVIGEPCPEADVSHVLGAPLFDRLLDAGLLQRVDDGVASPWALTLYDRTLVLSDVPGAIDGVVDVPASATLVAAAYPPARVASVLHLGSGDGALALVLSQSADRVVGLDERPRAVALARINARLNAITNVEFRLGDGLAADEGAPFELVAGRLPFGPDLLRAPAETQLGDERALAILGAVPQHLAPGGRAVLLAEWPELDEEAPILARLRARLDTSVDLLALLAPPITPDVHAVRVATALVGALDGRFAQLATELRDRLQRASVRAIREGLTILRRRALPGVAITASVDVAPMGAVQPSSTRIGRLLAARDLLAVADTTLLEASLRIPPKTTLVSERDASDPGASVRAHARFSPRAMIPPLGLNDEAATLARLVHQAGSIGEAIAFYQRTLGVDAAAARAKLLPHAREALERGLLEPAPGG